METWQQIWQAVQPTVVSLAAGLIIVLAGWLIALVKGKLAEVKNAALRELVTSLVLAAEQKYNAGEGKAKFTWVVAQLEARGFDPNEALIEAEVYWLSTFIRNKEAQP